VASSSLSWAVQQSHNGLPFTFLGCGLWVLAVSDARAMGLKCWLGWSLARLRGFNCGGALVRRSDRMELRVGRGSPDDVDVSAGWVLVAVYPPRLQGLEVCAVSLVSLLVGESGS
jgi:hypothetical protein